MQAIALRQPIVWLLINGYEDTIRLGEPCKHVGEVAICATVDPIEGELFAAFQDLCKERGVKSYPKMNDFEIGGFIGTADLVSCEADPSGSGFLLKFENANELRFVPRKQREGLFRVKGNPFTDSWTDLPRPIYGDSAALRGASHAEGKSHSNRDAELSRAEEQALQAKENLKKQVKELGKVVAEEVTRDLVESGAKLLTRWLGSKKRK